MYALDFPAKLRGYSKTQGSTDFVRKRRWTRAVVITDLAKLKPTPVKRSASGSVISASGTVPPSPTDAGAGTAIFHAQISGAWFAMHPPARELGQRNPHAKQRSGSDVRSDDGGATRARSESVHPNLDLSTMTRTVVEVALPAGLSFKAYKDTAGEVPAFFVTKVIDGGNAKATGQIAAGNLFDKVNGVCVRGFNREEVTVLIKVAQEGSVIRFDVLSGGDLLKFGYHGNARGGGSGVGAALNGGAGAGTALDLARQHQGHPVGSKEMVAAQMKARSEEFEKLQQDIAELKAVKKANSVY